MNADNGNVILSLLYAKPLPYFTFQYANHPKLTVSALSLSSDRLSNT